MKKISLTLVGILSISLLTACDDRDDIREGIDELNVRLDDLEAKVIKTNRDLDSYRNVLDGSILITRYSVNEFGDYAVTFSDGNTMAIYSGKAEEEMPVLSIGDDGWYYTQGGITYPLKDTEGNQVPALGSNGRTPEIRINNSGMWEYSFDGGDTWLDGFGTALPRNGVSIFDDVRPTEDGNSLVFKWHTGEEQHEATIALYGLNLTIDIVEETFVFTTGQSKEYTVTQTGVEKALIETNLWGVKLEENTLKITSPNTIGEEVIRIKIFSKAGYCKLVSIPVSCQ